jgi:fructose-1,6-bisphosphatase I
MTQAAQALSTYLMRQAVGRSVPERELATLLTQMSFAAKVLAREIRRAALVGRLGLVGDQNPTGDAQKKLDVYSNEIVINAIRETGLVAAIVSEEMEELHTISCRDRARYLLSVDPLDGSSNTDINGAMGTIFAFWHRTHPGPCRDAESELHDAVELAATGYVMYGPSTILICSRGAGVDGFTLDHDVGEFLLSHDQIRCPSRGPYYSANLAHLREWEEPVQRFVAYVTTPSGEEGGPYSLRYTGALVADLHRSLLDGGIYFYPRDAGNPNGKLRLLYECAPLAHIAEQAGGRASTGRDRILDIRPESLHQRVPLAIGSSADVQLFERFLSGRQPQL